MKKTIAIFTALLLVLSVSAGAITFFLGTINNAFSEMIAPDLTYRYYDITSNSGPQKVFTTEVNLSNPNILLAAGRSNGYVYSRQTVPNMATDKNNQGIGQVVFGVNGDFFNFDQGVPFGIFMEDGEILTTPPQYSVAFGMDKDGKPFIVSHGTMIDVDLYVNGVRNTVTGINNPPKSENSLMLYTDAYAKSTKTDKTYVEALCTVLSGSARHGEVMNLRVEKVNDLIGNTALTKGQAVLSARGAAAQTLLRSLVSGQEISVQFKMNTFWSNVDFAVSGDRKVLSEASVVKDSNSTKAARTLVGIKPDGNVVFACVDGRMPAYSVGITYEQAGTLLANMGCTEGINLDGGGSTTFIMRPLGDSVFSLINKPSDGTTRAVANGILVLNTAIPSGVSELILKPKISPLYLLGGTYPLSVSGVDANLQPVSVNSVTWFVDPAAGYIDEGGKFTPALAGDINVIAYSGAATGNRTYTVVDAISEIKSTVKSIAIDPGQKLEIPVELYKDGKAVTFQKELLSWAVEGDGGVFNTPGVFEAKDTTKGGYAVISYNGTSLKIPIESKKPPVIINDFEDETTGFLLSNSNSKVYSAFKFETLPQYNIFGQKSIKYYYDFVRSDKLPAGTYMMTNPGGNTEPMYIKDYPEKLGLWVYGDGSGVSLRSIITDANNTQKVLIYGTVNFVGWNYMEAPVPKDLALPLYVKVPFNIVSAADKKTKGSLWFDRLRAVYTPIVGEDYQAPVMTKSYPAEGKIITQRKPEINLLLTDNVSIDPKTIKLTVNGYTIPDGGGVKYESGATGRVKYQVKNNLKNGRHTIQIFVRDTFGNPLFKTITFEVRA